MLPKNFLVCTQPLGSVATINKYYGINQIIFKMSTALITGVSGGIGKAFADELAARRTNLFLVASLSEKLNQIATKLQQKYQVKVGIIAKYFTLNNAINEVFISLK